MEVFDNAPLWTFFLGVILIALLCFEAGYFQGKRLSKASAGQSEAPIGAMVSGVLALLAFMLAFTFGIASSRFDERRLLVVDEANAIGTTYLRAEFLDEPARANVKKLLREYVALRLDVCAHPEHVQDAIAQAESLQQRLWTEAVELGRKRPTPISSLFITSLNDVIDLQAKRITAGLHTRVPAVVWYGLLFISALSMVGVGYYAGRGGTGAWPETLILVTAFGTILFLVADLDRPSQGYLRVNQQPLTDLARQIGCK